QLGVGDGTFTDAQALGVGFEPQAVAVADLNEDGLMDIVVVNSSGGESDNGSLTILEGVGGGVFDPPAEELEDPSFMYPWSVVIEDIDGDDNLDLLVVNNDDVTISVLRGSGDLQFDAADTFEVGDFPESAALGDFDGDGFLDVATTHYFDDNVTVLIGQGEGSFGEASTLPVGVGPRTVHAADFNRDGKLDLLTVNQDDGTVTVLLNQSTPPPTPTPTQPPAPCTGDCDGSGDVTVDEILTMVNIALGNQSVAACVAADSNQDQQVTVDEILVAVNNALGGC
ncbi:MAG TPA: VCBS repeat-containing protein, partial [Terriglobales bacterium]|nr:VCBS repeat-containing protein [Terriglobales bacterium]